ncbi:MAG: glycosyltransferase [Hyphomicrobiales bacterium]
MNTHSVFAVQVVATKSFGGIETAALAYAHMFDELGIPSVCLYRGPGTEMLSSAGVTVMPLPDTLTGPLKYIPFVAMPIISKLKTLAGKRTLLFVVHSDLALQALRRHFPQAKFVAPCHSDKATRKKDADLAITLNKKQQAHVETILEGHRAKAVELGNPFITSRKKAPASDKMRIVFCARFTPVKNPLAVIKAHACLNNPPPLLMIGDGDLMGEAREAAGDDVEFLGWRGDPWQHISRDDILISPSSWEGLPYMILEALDRGVPVIASDIAGHCAALNDGDYGTLTPLGDHAALVATVQEAIANPNVLRDKAEKGIHSISTRFGPKYFWQRLSSALSEKPAV